MKAVEVQSDIGLADGEVTGCERIGATLVVRVTAWNNRELQLKFEDVQLVLDFTPGDISALFRFEEDTKLLRQALEYAYEAPPKQHPYKHFAFLNNQDHPCLEVVAAKLEITAT